jgi:RNA polymerase sigma-70 factor (ECF subfamily)
MHDTDAELGLIQSGDADAFARWIASVERTLRLSLKSFAATVDVEAVLQEALLRTWNVAARVEPDGKPDALFRMALRIARNLAISEHRKTRRLVSDDDALVSLADDVSPPPVDTLLLERVRECNTRLPEKPRQALAARLASMGADPDEVLAARLSMRLNTFLQNFTRARKLLLECLRAMGIDIAELP